MKPYCRCYVAISFVISFAVCSIRLEAAPQRPYDCPNSASKLRRNYVCLMNSKVAPKLWKDWAKVRKTASTPYQRYSERFEQCNINTQNRFNQCTSRCTTRCNNSASCLANCTSGCDQVRLRAERACSRSDFGSKMIKKVKALKGLARRLKYECALSLNSPFPCEHDEARPYCVDLIKPIDKYLSELERPYAPLNDKVVAFAEGFAATHSMINSRHRGLSKEIKTKAFKCPKKDAHQIITQRLANGQDQKIACIMPINSPDVSTANTLLDIPMTLAAFLPDLTLLDLPPNYVGATCDYCWKIDCSANPDPELGEEPCATPTPTPTNTPTKTPTPMPTNTPIAKPTCPDTFQVTFSDIENASCINPSVTLTKASGYRQMWDTGCGGMLNIAASCSVGVNGLGVSMGDADPCPTCKCDIVAGTIPTGTSWPFNMTWEKTMVCNGKTMRFRMSGRG